MMNPLYASIARLIRMNTLKNRFNTTEVIDKENLVKALSDYFKGTDALFFPNDFEKTCSYEEEGQ